MSIIDSVTDYLELLKSIFDLISLTLMTLTSAFFLMILVVSRVHTLALAPLLLANPFYATFLK